MLRKYGFSLIVGVKLDMFVAGDSQKGKEIFIKFAKDIKSENVYHY